MTTNLADITSRTAAPTLQSTTIDHSLPLQKQVQFQLPDVNSRNKNSNSVNNSFTHNANQLRSSTVMQNNPSTLGFQSTHNANPNKSFEHTNMNYLQKQNSSSHTHSPLGFGGSSQLRQSQVVMDEPKSQLIQQNEIRKQNQSISSPFKVGGGYISQGPQNLDEWGLLAKYQDFKAQKVMQEERAQSRQKQQNFKQVLDNHQDLHTKNSIYKKSFEQIIDKKVIEFDEKMRDKQQIEEERRVSGSRRKRRELEDQEKQMRRTMQKLMKQVNQTEKDDFNQQNQQQEILWNLQHQNEKDQKSISRRIVRQELDRQMDMQKQKKYKIREEDKIFGAIYNARTELEHKKHYENLVKMNKYISKEDYDQLSQEIKDSVSQQFKNNEQNTSLNNINNNNSPPPQAQILQNQADQFHLEQQRLEQALKQKQINNLKQQLKDQMKQNYTLKKHNGKGDLNYSALNGMNERERALNKKQLEEMYKVYYNNQETTHNASTNIGVQQMQEQEIPRIDLFANSMQQ
eukprot:403350450